MFDKLYVFLKAYDFNWQLIKTEKNCIKLFVFKDVSFDLYLTICKLSYTYSIIL